MTLLTNTEKVADPYRPFFPNNDANSCNAQSIKDMRFYKEAIYIGCKID